jgi:hypothetical protein
MSQDEAIEALRQIRLSRRIPTRKVSNKKVSKKASKKIPKINSSQAKNLLDLIKQVK